MDHATLLNFVQSGLQGVDDGGVDTFHATLVLQGAQLGLQRQHARAQVFQVGLERVELRTARLGVQQISEVGQSAVYAIHVPAQAFGLFGDCVDSFKQG